MIAFAYYMLKVMICSAVLFFYYHLALRNKLFHQWNRFYLLASIVIALIAPIVQITIVHYSHETPNKAIELLQVFNSADGYIEAITVTANRGISSEQWILIGYCLVSCVLFVVTALSLLKILSVLKSHTVRLVQDIRFVNTRVKGTPFSFFKFIFWNEEIDLQTETGRQIFEHELVHVKEKHSFDKLFVQTVLVFFWCNPFFWLIRRELKLIHEFIADKKAVGEHGTAALAAMILNASYPSHFNSLTNQFFQTSIKRRLAMLTKIQNPKVNYISRVLALPILALTVLAFSLKAKNVTSSSIKLDKEIVVVIDAAHGMMANGKYNGAVVDNIAEDDIVLAIANKIKELNTNDQIKIVFTRPTEQITDLHKRVDIARENNADLFLSLHVNALPLNSQKEVSGFQIYVSNKQDAFQQKSEVLGSVLREELNTVYPTDPSLLKRQTAIWVLDQNVCPSVLVEFGWLTTKKDRGFITKENNQKKIAQKILEAIEKYALNQQTQKINSDIVKDTVSNANIKKGKIIIESTSVMYIAKPSGETSAKRMFIINGKRVDPVTLYGKQIVSKKAIIYEKDQAEAIAKYGNEAKNGVAIFEDAKVEKLDKSAAGFDTLPKKQPTVIELITEPNAPKQKDKESEFFNLDSPNPPLYILDGKEIALKDLKKVDANEITSITVLKDKTAIDKYGEKGKNGVVIIITKGSIDFNELTIDTVPQKKNMSNLNRQNEPIFQKVEIEAKMDRKEWASWVSKTLQAAVEKAAADGIKPGTYTIKVKFIVMTDGSVTDIKALNDPGYGLAEAAVKTIQTGPKWIPARQNGKAVNSYHTQPITFVVQEQGNDEKKRVPPEVTLNDLKNWDRLNIGNLVSFELVSLSPNNGKEVTRHRNVTAKLDQTSRAMLAKQKPGDIFTIESIIVAKNGKEIKMPSKVYQVAQ